MSTVPGSGPVPCDLMLVGEAPGATEVKTGKPFTGKAGKELWPLLKTLELPRKVWYVTNVCKTRPPDNRDPTGEEIARDRAELLREVATVQPRLVLALGRISAEQFLGRPAKMENDHGRFYQVLHSGDHDGDYAFRSRGPLAGGLCHLPAGADFGFHLLVAYHPAAALHSPDIYTLLWQDLQELGMGGCRIPQIPSESPQNAPESTRGGPDGGYLAGSLTGDSERSEGVSGVDTEGTLDSPLGVSISRHPGEGLWAEGPGAPLGDIALHNALYDLPILTKLGYTVGDVDDTMIMAHILARPRIGLKLLAYRECGMTLSNYEDVVKPAQDAIAYDYLGAILDQYRPRFQERISEKTGKPLKPKQLPPGKVFAAAARCLKHADPYGLWQRQNPERHAEAEALLGYRMREATLEDVQ